MTWVAFGCGLFLGGFIGLIAMALLCVNKINTVYLSKDTLGRKCRVYGCNALIMDGDAHAENHHG